MSASPSWKPTLNTIAIAAKAGIKRIQDHLDLADFTIVCGEREWRVHRFILIMHSEVFQKACMSNFKEAKDTRLGLSVEPEATVECLVSYMYSFEYDYDETSWYHVSLGELSLHVKMYLLGDQYNIQDVRYQAFKKFMKALKSKELESNASEYSEAATLAYSARAAAKIFCIAIIGKLMKDPDVFLGAHKSSPFEQTLEQAPMLGIDFARAL